MKSYNGLWKEEIKKKGGVLNALRDRFTFHGGLTIYDIIKGIGVSEHTAKKLINENFIKISSISNEIYILCQAQE